MKHRKVLVTGGAGFIGANLVRRMLGNYQVNLILKPKTDTWRIQGIFSKLRVYKASLEDKASVKAIVGKVNPDFIFHLAAWGSYPGQTNPKKIFSGNIFGTLNLLSSLEKIKYQNMVVAGSSSEYGKKIKPMKEDDLAQPNNLYGVSKLAQTNLCQFWSKKYQKPVTVLRFFSVYGPMEEKGRLVRNVVEKALVGGNIKLATGKEARDFIYVEDIFTACLKAIRKKSYGEILNVGTGVQVTAKQLADIVIRLTKSKSKIILNAYPGRDWDTDRWFADTKKTFKELGFSSKYGIEDGLIKTIGWYRKYGS